jgi:hypothetical protein
MKPSGADKINPLSLCQELKMRLEHTNVIKFLGRREQLSTDRNGSEGRYFRIKQVLTLPEFRNLKEVELRRWVREAEPICETCFGVDWQGNGLGPAIHRDGRKIFIDRYELAYWLDSQSRRAAFEEQHYSE